MAYISSNTGRALTNAVNGVRFAFDYETKGKRIVDVVLSLLLLPLLLPIIAVLYVLVRLDGGPAFFGHTRVGRDGVEFRCWKLRSMVTDSQARLAEHLAADPEARAEWERDHKLTNDPRVTRLGDFLRRSSADELPQIWNVLKGEMSLVGPRPVTAEELARYQGYEWAYLSQRPGVTGLWQVSGRNDVSYAERVRMDVRYAKTLGPMRDFSILKQTGRAVLDRTGK